MTTCTEKDPKNKPQPQLVRLDRAFKLAEQWVNNMSKSSVDTKSTSVDLEGRPAGLGIGATVPKESRVTRSDNPVERKLIATLNANKKKAITKNEAPSAKVENVLDEESDEDESESKTRSFTKKRPQGFSHSLLQSKKKHK
ncbi:Protein of unknown function (DUF3245 [Striga hermonthica]|uniref:Uncharacterized protein n=1 Tax=Striga hermonthica TaxID=68872 RepID=A0A9N7N2C6_STRHE|nr:Protein of unknown function (DUF3245 [Striga hermonthica]